ncbi:MAG: hypothetical protein ACO3JL_13050 [Myxococcota bacterium]
MARAASGLAERKVIAKIVIAATRMASANQSRRALFPRAIDVRGADASESGGDDDKVTLLGATELTSYRYKPGGTQPKREHFANKEESAGAKQRIIAP